MCKLLSYEQEWTRWGCFTSTSTRPIVFWCTVICCNSWWVFRAHSLTMASYPPEAMKWSLARTQLVRPLCACISHSWLDNFLLCGRCPLTVPSSQPDKISSWSVARHKQQPEIKKTDTLEWLWWHINWPCLPILHLSFQYGSIWLYAIDYVSSCRQSHNSWIVSLNSVLQLHTFCIKDRQSAFWLNPYLST